MATLQEIMDDKDKYPDDTKILLAEGSEVPLGELRGGYMKDGDYRRKTTDVANQRRQLETERVQFEQARMEAENQLTELAKQAILTKGNEPVARDELTDLLERDPVAKALTAKLEAIAAKVGSLEEGLNTNKETLDQHAQTYVADQHRRVLAALKKQAGDRGLDFDEQGLIEYARNNSVHRLDHAYKLMEFDHIVKRSVDTAREEAHKVGMEEGKKAATQPILPLRRTAPLLPPDAPQTFEEAAEAALLDPEILAHMEGLH